LYRLSVHDAYYAAPVGTRFSVIDFVHLGSSLSLRSFSRLGAALSVLDFAHFGSSLSVRSFGRVGSNVKTFDNKVEFGSDATKYIQATVGDPATINAYVSSAQIVSMSGTAAGVVTGQLHGTWLVEADGGNIAGFSDIRLKENVRPLRQTLRETLTTVTQAGKSRASSASKAPESMVGDSVESTSEWLLEKLRPVSYQYKKGGPQSRMRFGFMADEMLGLLPQVTRGLEDSAGHVGIVYQDLLAVLMTMLEDMTSTMNTLRPRMQAVEERIARRRAWKRRRASEARAAKAAAGKKSQA